MLIDSKKFRQIFHRLRGRHIEFDLKSYQKLLTEINKYEHENKVVEDSHEGYTNFNEITIEKQNSHQLRIDIKSILVPWYIKEEQSL